MKKILVVAMMALFAVSAFALEATFKGKSEFKGQMFLNGSEDKTLKRTQSNYYQMLRFWSTITVDDVVSLHLRTTPVKDRIWGNGADTENGHVKLDRAYMTMVFGDFTVTMGDMQTDDYYAVDFGTLHLSPLNGNGTHAEGFKVNYAVQDGVNVFAVMQKNKETQAGQFDGKAHKIGTVAKNKDEDSYVIGADIVMDNLHITPSFGFQRDLDRQDHKRMTGHISGVYDSANLEVMAAVAFETESQKKGSAYGDGDVWEEDRTAYGIYLNGAYKTPDFKVGGLFAYGSSDKKKGNFFFGDDFDRTRIVDNQYFAGSGANGMWTVQAFGSFTGVADLTVDAVLAYYKSNLPKEGEYTHATTLNQNMNINEKSSVIEIDLAAKYQLTKSTTITVGAAHAINDKIYVGDAANNEKIESVSEFRWVLTTLF